MPTDKPPPNPKGALAQLVEHLHGMQGVSGSNPLRSTFLDPQLVTGQVGARKRLDTFRSLAEFIS